MHEDHTRVSKKRLKFVVACLNQYLLLTMSPSPLLSFRNKLFVAGQKFARLGVPFVRNHLNRTAIYTYPCEQSENMERTCVNEMVSGEVLEQPRSQGPPLPVPTEEVGERTWERGWF